MVVDYFRRTSLIAAYLLALGSASLLSQTNPKQHVKPQQGLEKITQQQSQLAVVDVQSMHYQLLDRINKLGEELLETATPKKHWGDKNVCDSLGYLVYDDLVRLASRFDRGISLEGLCVYAVNDEIVVDNLEDDVTYYRLVFYPNNTAIEAPSALDTFFGSDFENIRIKVNKNKGREVVEEQIIESNRFFSYVPDMEAYDFSMIHSRVSGLNEAFKRLRRVKPAEGGPADPKNQRNWYELHPVDASKFEYIEDQLVLIAAGLFERYGLYLDRFGNFRHNEIAGEYSTVDASPKGMIRVYAHTGYSQELKAFQNLILIVRDMPEAIRTTINLKDGKPDTTIVDSLMPVQK